jgi:acylaminoacyl-peptidase
MFHVSFIALLLLFALVIQRAIFWLLLRRCGGVAMKHLSVVLFLLSIIISSSATSGLSVKKSAMINQHQRDAAAYQDFVSSAVDFRDVYVRNGFVTATRSVRDIDTNSRRSFLYNIPLSSPSLAAPPMELSTKIKARIPSPSGAKLAVLVEESVPSDIEGKGQDTKRHVMEIWANNGHQLAKRIVLPSTMHGPVCTDFDWFGGISWSPDETALVYSAEVNKPKTASYFATPNKDDDKKDDNNIVGGQYTLGIGKKEDWGEKYGTTALLMLFCLNVNTGKIGVIENVPACTNTASQTTDGNHVLGQPIFSPCGKAVVYTGWDAGGGGEMPRRLGAIYCYHRPCQIYSSPVSQLLNKLESDDNEDEKVADEDYVCITPNDRLSRSPRFSSPSDGAATLAYLCNSKGFDTHNGCMALHTTDWCMSKGSVVDGTKEVVVDVVSLPGERGDGVTISGLGFPGLFLNQLSDKCFSPDGKFILTSTQWGSVVRVVSISLDDGSVTPVKFDMHDGDNRNGAEPSQQFLCFTDDGGAIVTQSECNYPTILGSLSNTFLQNAEGGISSQVLAELPPAAASSFSSSTSSGSCFKAGSGYSYKIMNILPEHGDVKVDVSSILLLPDDTGNEKLPLIVVPHGGPHSATPTSFVPSYGYLCQHGRYAVLHVNFRGSTGFGQAALESLAGNAGTLDVLDVVAATRAAINTGVIDAERVGICGGSHGGFLAAHLSGQHPDLFKVASMRNPCINIASMVTAVSVCVQYFAQ